jgi:hypothetical protein
MNLYVTTTEHAMTQDFAHVIQALMQQQIVAHALQIILTIQLVLVRILLFEYFNDLY